MMNKISKLIFVLILLYVDQQTAHAEVLEKFGGCQSPRYFIWLSIFIIAIGITRVLKKKRMSQFLLYLSIIYIFIDVFWYFLSSKKIIPSWFDQAMFDFYIEIQSCPQFSQVGYWQQSWLMVLIYFIVVLGIFKLTRSRFTLL